MVINTTVRLNDGADVERKKNWTKENIIVNIKEGTFSRMVFSISRLEGSHQAGFIKVSL